MTRCSRSAGDLGWTGDPSNRWRAAYAGLPLTTAYAVLVACCVASFATGAEAAPTENQPPEKHMSVERRVSDELDTIANQIGTHASFDVSPRGVNLRPDALIAAALQRVVSERDVATSVLSPRLLHETDAFAAMVWIQCLTAIATPAAAKAVDAFLREAEQDGRWRGSFPGVRELRLLAGRVFGDW
jgi:hypothetical protein